MGNPGYNEPSGFATAYSAYVLDHSWFNRYDAPSEVCAAAEPGVNYAFLADELAPVPEPGTLLLLGTAAAGLGLTRWREARRRRQET